MTDWRITGIEFTGCNCNWGCPCQFNALPSQGHCTGGFIMRIERGHLDGVPLDGVVWGIVAEWPGAIHEGNGRLLTLVDVGASDEQREALVAISRGQHSQEGTFFNILDVVCPTKLGPVFTPIQFEVDMEGRRARVEAGEALRMEGSPITNPVTGDPHFPRLVLPNGFEFKEAEFASSRIVAEDPIRLHTERSHAHFAKVDWGPAGYLG